MAATLIFIILQTQIVSFTILPSLLIHHKNILKQTLFFGKEGNGGFEVFCGALYTLCGYVNFENFLIAKVNVKIIASTKKVKWITKMMHHAIL